MATAVATALPSGDVEVALLGTGDSVAVNRDAKGNFLRGTLNDLAEASLPAAGLITVPPDLFADRGEKLRPNMVFAFGGIPIPEEFQTDPEAPAETVVASLDTTEEPAPMPRPRVAPLVAADEGGKGGETVLAYAPAGRQIEAPFEAVLGTPPELVKPKDERDDVAAASPDLPKASTPPARPNRQTLLGWLANRNLREFDPNSHSWASNPLPPSVHYAKEQNCLARGIYFEARGESELGQAGVAQVILNRVKNPSYPDTICGVVYQNKTWRGRCQFSFACDGVADRITSIPAWFTAQRIAREVTNGKIFLKEVGDSTHYHANYVKPGWARTMKKVDRIGAHIFYRTKNGGWS